MNAPRLRSQAAGIVRYYPFTIAGTLVFAIGVVFVARGSVLGDPYRASLGFLAVALPMLLAAIGRAQAGRFSEVEANWRASGDTHATMTEPDRCGHVAIVARGIRPWFFYRLLVRLSGLMQVGSHTSFHFHEELATANGELVRVPLPFPLPGKARLTCRLEIRDVFGMTRAAFGPSTADEVVTPAAMPRAPQLTRIVTETGGEESTRVRSPEEERYYMREYIPGDRLRDINWKASSRIRELFARVSPDTQEQSRILTIYLRNFAEPQEISVEALAHSAYIGGWLIAFLRTSLREEPDLTLRVMTARGPFTCADEAAVEELSWELADLWLDPEPLGLPLDNAARQVIVFSTPFDTGFDSFATRLGSTTIHLFTTQLARTGNGTAAEGDIAEEERVAVFFGGSLVPVSRVRLFAKDRSLVRSCPDGSNIVEQIGLRLICDRRSYEHAGARGGYP